MNYIIKKGRLNSTLFFVLTGLFLIISFSYQLIFYLKENDFIIKFPGDWDKPLGIIIGFFLIIRSQRFKKQRKGLYIKLYDNELEFRTKESDHIQKINLISVDKAYPIEDGILIKTKKQNEITIDLNSIKSEKKMKEVRKKLIELILGKRL